MQQKYLAHQAASAEEDEDKAEVEADLDEEDPLKAADYQELLDAINDAREQGSRLDDQLLTRLFRDWLHSKPCQNQGFVLDGYPKTIDQAKELFSGKLTGVLWTTSVENLSMPASGIARNFNWGGSSPSPLLPFPNFPPIPFLSPFTLPLPFPVLPSFLPLPSLRSKIP